ncbi:1,6-anhydro-N-acetylmuramyl-L-alanine amidase AmpD [Rhodoferax sp.]|uniref:1,6-anhydro-N-acetylmuramyl-L-alanine amidase AmpD n=1 Tax=Rhodoferax sp. TaxID=50421 RepID=UPI0025D1B007|nr:1,6-anhydro-N-acetylmuramyl-L-alanine amidase AmpD [Rhodoferax sp.]
MAKRTEPVTESDGCWSEGWWSEARHESSPNFGPRPLDACTELVVLHSISLPPGEYGGDGVRQLFTNALDWDAHPYFQTIRGMQVSSHFFVTRAGVVWQFVSGNDRAWHAGTSSHRGKVNCNDYSIGIELEGMDDDRFTEVQYQSLERLCAAIAQNYGIRYVAGHEHIAPGRKTDPGPGFEWSRLAHWPAISNWELPAELQESDKS